MNRIKRRDFIRISVASAVMLKSSFLFSQDSVPKKKNILFIPIDDLKPLLGCYGNPDVKSPNMDKLAGKGMVFINNYCQQAVCGPSRLSLLTGLRPDSVGIYGMKTKMRQVNPDILTLPQYFRQNGYETTGTGKIFDSRNVDKGHDTVSWSMPYVKPWNNPLPQAYRPIARGWYQGTELKKQIMDLEKEARAKGITGFKEVSDYVKEHGANTFPATECADVPDGAYRDGSMAKGGVKMLRKLAKQDKPFFLAVGFLKPHLPFVAPKKYWDLYNRDDINLHPFQEKAKHSPALAYHNFEELRSYTDIPKTGKLSEEKQRELIHGYYACISYVDAQVGKLLDELDKLGIADNTIVVLWGDHGWHLGDHDLWCKHTNFEQATRSPMIIYDPSIKSPKNKCHALTEFVDIFPTLCELTGLDIPEHLEGTSAVPLLKDPERKWKKAAISQFHRYSPKNPLYMGYSLRTKRYRYTEWQDLKQSNKVAYRELYDYETDPHETTNQAGNPDYADIVMELSHLMSQGWKGALPE